PPPQISTLSLHDALPISMRPSRPHHPTSPNIANQTRSISILLAILFLLPTTLLPSETFAARQPTGSGIASSPTAPLVTGADYTRSEEHTSELQSLAYLVC